MLLFRQYYNYFLLVTKTVNKKKRIPNVATNVGMLGFHDIKTAVVNTQIIRKSMLISDLICLMNFMVPALCLDVLMYYYCINVLNQSYGSMSSFYQ